MLLALCAELRANQAEENIKKKKTKTAKKKKLKKSQYM